MSRVALSALVPFWIFAWFAAGGALMTWANNDRNRDAWWSLPLTMAVCMPGLFAMAGGIVFVVFLWIEPAG